MAEHLASIFGTEKDRVNCPFYFKVREDQSVVREIFFCVCVRVGGVFSRVESNRIELEIDPR